ncbi:multidrug resistance-associated protein 4 [Cricetulus griseus]|nr:multidrug resistance-associated protein 4 [Cricetulus griseus]
MPSNTEQGKKPVRNGSVQASLQIWCSDPVRPPDCLQRLSGLRRDSQALQLFRVSLSRAGRRTSHSALFGLLCYWLFLSLLSHCPSSPRPQIVPTFQCPQKPMSSEGVWALVIGVVFSLKSEAWHPWSSL